VRAEAPHYFLVGAADVGGDFAGVEIGEFRVEVGGEGRERGGAGVGAGLVGIFGAGDDGADGVEIEAPAEREFGEREAGGNEGFQRVGELDAFLEREAGEGFADVEGGAVAVEVAMVVGGEGGGLGHLAAEETAGEREADEESDLPAFGFVEEDVRGFLAEEVEDDLEGGDALLFHAEKGFFHGFDADAEVADFAFAFELAEMFEDLAALEDVERDAVELGEIEGIDAEAFEGSFGVLADGGAGEVVGPAGRVEAAELGGDVEIGAGFFEEFADERFAATGAVDIGGVEERGAGVDGGAEGLEGGFVGDVAPVSADLPAAESDFADGAVRGAKRTGIHGGDGGG